MRYFGVYRMSALGARLYYVIHILTGPLFAEGPKSNVPQTLGSAIARLGRQADVMVTVDLRLVVGHRTAGLHGSYACGKLRLRPRL